METQHKAETIKNRGVNAPGNHLPFFQPKLTINQPNDVYEQEADAMADYAISTPDPPAQENAFTKPDAGVVQRKCTHCEDEEKKMLSRKENESAPELDISTAKDARVVQRKCAHCEDEEKKMLSRKENGAAPELDTIMAEKALQIPGEKLHAKDRHFMEQRFGYDFGGVQIHNDTLAHQSSASIQAKAFTSDNHIVFGQGNYQPDTLTGRHLLAHELTHVVQQSNNLQRKLISRAPTVELGEPEIREYFYTKGNIKEDVKFLKQAIEGFTKAVIVQGSILMIYKIDGATPIQLKSFNLKKDIVMMPIYHLLGNDERSYPMVYDLNKNAYDFVGKGVPGTDEQKKKMHDMDEMYTVSNWFANPEDKDKFEKSFDGDTIGLIVMPYASGSGGGASKGEDNKQDDAPPPKPTWADAFEKTMADQIASARKSEPSSEDIPDECKLYYSKNKSKWRSLANQTDTASKTKTQVYLDVAENYKPADVLSDLRQLIRIQKLKSVKDATPDKDAKELSKDELWAVELKLKIEKLIADERKTVSNPFDLPDKIALTGKDDDSNVYLKVIVFTDSVDAGAKQTQMKSGVLPDPLQKGMQAEDVLKVVKTATKQLKGGDIKEESTETKHFDHVKDAYPSNITAKDVRPDGITVTNAHHNFQMDVQIDKKESGLLNQVTIHMRTVFYYWDIYKVDDQLTDEERQGLSQSWKERRDQLTVHFKNSSQLKTKPLVNAEALESYNAQMDNMEIPGDKVDTNANLTRQQIEELKSAGIFYGSRLSITPEADFSFPKQEGDYVVYCRAQLEPGEDTIVRPSESFFAINVQDASKLAKQSVDKPFNEIEDTKKQLAEATTDAEKKRLQDKLNDLTTRQESPLAKRLTNDISSTDDNIRLANKLKDIYLKNTTPTTPFSLILAADKVDGKKMLDMWTMLSLSEPSKPLDQKIDSMIANLTAQRKGYADVQSNLQSFSDDYDQLKPTYTPVVSLISEETGQEYQLITMIAEAKGNTDEETKVVLIDVTTHKTQRKYSGSSTNKDKAAALKEAIQDAFNDFGKECEYGRGTLQYRIPVINASGSAKSKPGIRKTILNILEGVAAVAGIAALILGTIGTGGALAVALGVGASVIGAGMAGYHIYDRLENHKLEPDAELAMDVLNMLGPLLVGLSAASKAAKGIAVGLKAAEGISAANTFLRIEKGIAMVQKLELVTNFFVINYKTAADLVALQDADLPPEQKDALEKQIMINAILSNVMVAVAVRNEMKAKVAPDEAALNEMISNAANEQKYRRQLQKDGLMDAEGNWTVPALKEAAAKTKVTEPENTKTPKDEETKKPAAEENIPPAVKGNDEPHIPDDYEKARKVKMKGHAESPDHQHEVEAYPDGTSGRCSGTPGVACPLITVTFKATLDKRPALKKRLDAKLAEIAAFGATAPKPRMDELGELEQLIRTIEETFQTSSVPKGYKIKEVDYTDHVDLPGINEKTFLEYPWGERVWRNKDGSISHEGIIGNSVGRKGLEKEWFTGTDTGLSNMGKYERAHSFGQGFGWESPYGLFYAPKTVNQKLQNNGIEQYIRLVRDSLPAGHKIFVETNTNSQSTTARLENISYEAYVIKPNGEKVEAFNYRIDISGSRDAPVLDAQPIQFSTPTDPGDQKLITDLKGLDKPDWITKPQHINGF